MKQNIKHIAKAMFGLMAILFAASSCQKDTVDPNPTVIAPKSVAEIISTDEDFSFLKAALDRANLTSSLGSGSLTVFAPTNAAFKASGFGEKDADVTATIAATDPAVMATFLKTHILNSSVLAKDVPVGINKSLATQGGNAFVSNFNYGTNNGNPATYGIGVNGARVSFADVVATNGVVHKMDAVISPVTGNIMTALQANPDYSLLVQALTKAGLNTSLSGTGPFTVFAPTNTAFTDAGINAAFITATPAATLADILKYHVIIGRVFTTNFVPSSISGSDFEEALVAEARVKETLLELTKNTVLGYSFADNVLRFTDNKARIDGKTNTARTITKNLLTRPNIAATNGVIHAIDKVLTIADKNIVTLLTDNPDKFSILVHAATYANLVSTLSTTNPITVCAPVNDAFISYWKIDPVLKAKVLVGGVLTDVSRNKTKAEIVQEAKDSISSQPQAAIAALLSYHVISNRSFTNWAKGEITMLSGNKANVDGLKINEEEVIIENVKTKVSTAITTNDIGATNGVIHVIDKVLKKL
jgi:uncharacterized surface protein with fasciclin (FAS1) repeats